MVLPTQLNFTSAESTFQQKRGFLWFFITYKNGKTLPCQLNQEYVTCNM